MLPGVEYDQLFIDGIANSEDSILNLRFIRSLHRRKPRPTDSCGLRARIAPKQPLPHRGQNIEAGQVAFRPRDHPGIHQSKP